MSEEIKEMDKEFNQTAIKQELASRIDKEADIASMESNKNLMDEAIGYFNKISMLPVIMNPEHSDRIERMAKRCQKYKDIENYLGRVKEERGETLVLLEDCLSEISGDCIASCDHSGTPDCMDDCDTYNLKERIKTILKKAKG